MLPTYKLVAVFKMTVLTDAIFLQFV